MSSNKINIPQPDFVYDPISDKRETPNIKPDKLDKPKKKRRWWKWLLFIIISLGIAYGLMLLLNVSKISTNPFGFGKLKGEADGRINILVLGVGDPGHEGEGLADTTMVASIDTKNNKIAMISIPRDTRVKIPGYGSLKINNAHAYGEVALARQVVENTLDIPIHYYVRANFSGLKQAVDAVGGVNINVKEAMYDPEYPCEKNEARMCGFKIKAGQTQMNGATALKYARCRKGSCGDDFGRAARQQEVLIATRDKALSSGTILNPAKLSALASALGNNIKTDLSINNVMRLRELTEKVDSNQIIKVVFSIKPNGFLEPAVGSSDLVPTAGDFSEIQAFVADVFSKAPLWSEEPTVAIENGTTTVGLGGKLQTKLENNSPYIIVASLSNAITNDHTVTMLIDNTGGKKPHTAKYFEDLLKVKASKPDTPAKVPAADFTIIIGTDYANYLGSSSPGSNTSSSSSD